eukprot:scaffold1508_cov186-Alexandrium_tamarense.AAC.16
MITLTLWMAHRIFELAPVKTTALTWRLRPLGHEVEIEWYPHSQTDLPRPASSRYNSHVRFYSSNGSQSEVLSISAILSVLYERKPHFTTQFTTSSAHLYITSTPMNSHEIHLLLNCILKCRIGLY